MSYFFYIFILFLKMCKFTKFFYYTKFFLIFFSMNKFRLSAHFLQLFYTPYDRNTIAKSLYKRATSSIYSRHKLQKTHHKRSLIIKH